MTTVHRTKTDAEFEEWFRSIEWTARHSEAIALELARDAAVNSAETKFHTGHYAASWRALRTRRGGARFVNEDSKARMLELGTGEFGPRHRPIVAKPRIQHIRAHKRTVRLPDGSRKTIRIKAQTRVVRSMVFRAYGPSNAFSTAPTTALDHWVHASSVRGQEGSHAGHRAVVNFVRSHPGTRFIPIRDL